MRLRGFANPLHLRLQPIQYLKPDLDPLRLALRVFDQRATGNHLPIGQEGIFAPVAWLDEHRHHDHLSLPCALRNAGHLLALDELRVQEALAYDQQSDLRLIDLGLNMPLELVAGLEFLIEPESDFVAAQRFHEEGNQAEPVIRIQPSSVFARVADKNVYKLIACAGNCIFVHGFHDLMIRVVC